MSSEFLWLEDNFTAYIRASLVDVFTLFINHEGIKKNLSGMSFFPA